MEKILEDIKNYYTNKILTYGPSPNGVDWKDEASQILRFEKLTLILTEKSGFSIVDLGCGYGKYYEYLLTSGFDEFIYYGYDLSDEMIKNAIDLYGIGKNRFFRTLHEVNQIEKSDYIVASGIFNVKMSYTESQWLHYILSTLEIMNEKSIKGFAFNVLTKYSDPQKMRNDLYYADPLFFFDFCKRNFSKNVALLHDYGLYEFTILVRKGV